jgi:glycosyltransferase involved in cell wall biosynthesis
MYGPKTVNKQTGKRVSLHEPRVSIVIPVFNVAAYIAETLDSVLAQSYRDYEVIVVNDGSEDTEFLEKELEPYFDSIVYIKQDNYGASSARNAAIWAARGSLLAFLDGDDHWLPSYLSDQLEFLDSKDLDMVYCDAYLFGENQSGKETYMDQSPSDGAVTPESLISWTCNVITSGTIVKKHLIEEARFFDLRLRTHQDFDMWFNLAKRGARIGYQRKVLAKYRVRTSGLSGSGVERAERNISSLEWTARKYELTVSERAAWQKEHDDSWAVLALEKAKHCVALKEYTEAASHLTEANSYFRKQKLAILISLLRICPLMVREIFKRLRPAEFAVFTSEGTVPHTHA